MSLSSLFYFGMLFGAYKLGAYNATNPGEFWQRTKAWSVQMWRWLNPQGEE